MPVDSEPVWVKQEPGGNTFVRMDGSVMIGTKVGDAYDETAEVTECYESHFATCPAGGCFRTRKPRTSTDWKNK